MALNFTPSADGKPRADLRITLRLSADEIEEIKRIARYHKTPWRVWLEEKATDGIFGAIVSHNDQHGYD